MRGSEALRDLVRAREAAKQDQMRARHRLSKFLLSSASAIWSKVMDAPLSDLGCAVALHADSSGGHASGSSARGRAHAGTGSASGASHHGKAVKLASPSFQQASTIYSHCAASQISRL